MKKWYHIFKGEDFKMTKENAIKRFIDCCKNPKNDKIRKVAVENQYTRTVWELYDKNGLIRIRFTGSDKGAPNVTVFHAVKFATKNSLPPTFEAELSEEEYENLRKTFFGNYKPKYDWRDEL
jgi:hypothetical protein